MDAREFVVEGSSGGSGGEYKGDDVADKMPGKDNSKALPYIAEDELPDSLLNFWWPVCYQNEMKEGEVFATELFGEPLVLFRNDQGKIVCVQDVCPHRSTPLSLGFVKGGELYCRYHGWRFGGEEGQCTAVPSLPNGRVPRAVKTQGHPVVEAQFLVWVFPGDSSLAASVPLPPEMEEENDPDTWPMVRQVWESNYSYISIMENLLDPCHLQFTHEGQQQKNIAEVDAFVPDAFKFKLWDWRTDKTLPKYSMVGHIVTDVTKKPMDYTLYMHFPSLQRAEVRLKTGWTFKLNHYVTPLRKGKTRIFLKTARNFIKFIPHEVFAKSNDSVMQQDLTVLTAQQMRLRQGASRWNFPVPADACSLSYRRFWDACVKKNGRIWFKDFTRTNVVKSPTEKGCTRGAAAEIEDLPAFVSPRSGVKDHQEGLEELWQSSAAKAWPSAARSAARSVRAPHALGSVGSEGRWLVPLLKQIGIFLAVFVVLNCAMVGLWITASATYGMLTAEADPAAEGSSYTKIVAGGAALVGLLVVNTITKKLASETRSVGKTL